MITYDAAELRREIEADEGCELYPYRCPSGALTIGIGHNLDANGIPQHIADALYAYDVGKCEAALDAMDQWWRDKPDVAQRVMLNMVLNLGRKGWSRFVATRAALQRDDWAAAADGLTRSLWYKQVQSYRSGRMIGQLRALAKGG